MIVSYGYIEHISEFPTDNRAQSITFINLNESRGQTGVLVTYFSDHKAVWIPIKKTVDYFS